jgi:hypothetical protein
VTSTLLPLDSRADTTGIAISRGKATLDVTSEQVIREWRQDLKDNPT